MLLSNNFYQQNELLYQGETSFTSARKMFEAARQRASIGMLLGWLGLKRSMVMLSERIAGKRIQGQHSAGLKVVEVSRIRGSESRSKDFDRTFAPLSDRMGDRWTRIALARLRRQPLPPVDLLQVGDEYYVRDGHHRVSVARALGIAFIDADVTVLVV